MSMSRSDIDETVRDIWSTRPHRRRDDRKIAGVAAAIARRYRIDPILVRVAFVVSTVFGGIGIMLYLLGWLLLRQEGDETSAAESLIGHGRSSMSKPLTIVLALALIPASSGLFTAKVSALFSLAAVAAAVYLLHKHRGATPGADAPVDAVTDAITPMPPTAGYGTAAGQPTTAGHASAGQTTATGQTTAAGQPAGAGQGTAPGAGETTPPAWDPLGVAPFAWDLPEPAPTPPPPPPPKRRRSAVTPITLALALMVAGAGSLVALSSSSIGAPEVAAATLAVIGAGLLVGSFTRGGRGLIAVAIPLAIATYVMSLVPADHFGPNGVGSRTWVVNGIGELQPTYRHSIGDATLDLRGLTLQDTDVVTTTVQLGLGDLNVLLPPNANVEVHCEAGLGEVNCLGGHASGHDPVQERLDLGADGERGGKIVLNASVGTGDLAVDRG